jgi:hypothetical protein
MKEHATMPVNFDPLIYDFVKWVAREPRPYAQVMETWRTSCPRLTIWEDAVDRGLVERRNVPGEGQIVLASAAGLAFLAGYERREAAGQSRPGV